jgi:hypothetical protein
MDWNEIERLRIDGFTVARRGYDRREVDKFLGALLDWLEKDRRKTSGGWRSSASLNSPASRPRRFC